MQAAIASLLELPLEHVPDFKNFEKKWFLTMYNFLTIGGYEFDGTLYNPKALLFRHPEFYKEKGTTPSDRFLEIKDMPGVKGYFFANVFSPMFFNESEKDFTGHAVIIDKDFNIVHDPNPKYEEGVTYPKSEDIGYNGIDSIYMINEKNNL